MTSADEGVETSSNMCISTTRCYNQDQKMAFVKKEFKTAEEVISHIEDLETEEVVDAVIIPPQVDELTDEEDIKDSSMILNDDGKALPADVAGSFELHATLESEFSDSEPESEPESLKELYKQKKRTAKWCKCSPNYPNKPKNLESKRVQGIRNKIGGSLTPIRTFELFLNKTILDEIVEFSVKYARRQNDQEFRMRRSDLKKFIGVLIFSGYHSLPQTKFYWSSEEDKGVPLVRRTMPRNRFDEIKKYIHLSDSDKLDKTDKFSKIRPFFNHLNRQFAQFGVFSHEISIDEQMVPHFGRHSPKTFIRGKPVRFGFKLWCMASAEGYLYQFEPYGGASQRNQENLNLGERVVTNFLKIVADPENHVVFFDDFFTTRRLLTLLSEMKFFAAGTVRESRMVSCPLRTVKVFKKEPKGSCDYRFDKVGRLFALRWRDNGVVTVLTNFGTLDPTIPVRRYSYKEKRYRVISQPNIIHQCNKGMGGVDLHDTGIANYRIRIRGKKWWWPLFVNAIDSAVVNAWKLYQLVTGSAITQADFRSQVALCLMKAEETDQVVKSKKEKLTLGRSSTVNLPEAIRSDRVDHIIVRNEDSARRRCKGCQSQTVYQCQKCQVHVHVKCFSKFHE